MQLRIAQIIALATVYALTVTANVTPMFKGDDCSKNISLDEILSQPADITIGYIPTNDTTKYHLTFDINEKIQHLFIYIMYQKKFQLVTMAWTVSLLTIIFLKALNTTRVELKYPVGYLNNFTILINATTYDIIMQQVIWCMHHRYLTII